MKRIGASLGALAALACVLLAVALAAPRVLGLTPFVVLSGSMEPTYPVGSLVYVRSVDASELRVGDPVTFTLEGREAVATHRVIEVDAESASLRTQGDANDEPDGSPVQFASVHNWQPGLLCPAGRLRGVVGLPASGAVRGCGGDRLPFRLGLGLIEALWTKSAECARRGIKCKI